MAVPDSALAMITATSDGIVIDVRVIPRAARSGVHGTRAGAVLVRLQAPPVDGAANAELLAVMAGALGVPQRSVSIVSGPQSRLKRVRVVGINAATATARLLPPPPPEALAR